MSSREVAIERINRLPEETPREELARRLEFVAGVKEGLEQADREEDVPIEEVPRLLEAWISETKPHSRCRKAVDFAPRAS
jgi:predicted transcriptional regulator